MQSMKHFWRAATVLIVSTACAGGALAQKDWCKSKWGPNDEIGAANLLTQQLAAEAAKLVKTGKTYALGFETSSQTAAYAPRTWSVVVLQPGQAGGISLGGTKTTYNDDIYMGWLAVGRLGRRAGGQSGGGVGADSVAGKRWPGGHERRTACGAPGSGSACCDLEIFLPGSHLVLVERVHTARVAGHGDGVRPSQRITGGQGGDRSAGGWGPCGYAMRALIRACRCGHSGRRGIKAGCK